ncbi:hypothetical protein ACKI14_49410, partial [Streptomyces turgidiscabies]|uniref:hypothetical protein n=1 Tax=Streptomyces turgidiscabies TaxID=85558 RepID=UPI0038F71DC5
CSSQRWDDVKFDSVDEAKKRAKFEAEMRRKIRAGIEAEQFLTAAQVAALQVDAPEPSLPEPGVIRPVRHRGRTVAALKAEPVAPSTH